MGELARGASAGRGGYQLVRSRATGSDGGWYPRARAGGIVLLLFVGLACARVPGPGDVPLPAEWPSAGLPGFPLSAPEAQGLVSARLAQAVNGVRERGLRFHSLTLVRHGKLVLDACFDPYDCRSAHDVASVTKSVVATLAAIAADRGQLDLDAPMVSFFSARKIAHLDERKARIRVRDLLGMTSGLDCGGDAAERDLYAMMEGSDWVQFALDLPMAEEPGRTFRYCSPGYHVVAAILAAATGSSIETFARGQLFDPLGIGEIEWPRDPQGLAHGWGDLRMHPQDMAKLGFLYLHGGEWRGHAIVSRERLRALTEARVAAPAERSKYGLGWWIPDVGLPGLFEARGRAGQEIVVWPAKDLVLVVTAGGAELTALVEPLLGALRSDSPLPDDPEGVAALAAAIVAARQPPAPHPVAPVPELARTWSGMSFALDRNPAGITSIGFTFGAGDETILQLVRGGERFDLAAGLDARYRTTARGPAGKPVAVRMEWRTDSELDVDLIEPAGVNHLAMVIVPWNDGIELRIADPSHQLDAIVHGVSLRAGAGPRPASPVGDP